MSLLSSRSSNSMNEKTTCQEWRHACNVYVPCHANEALFTSITLCQYCQNNSTIEQHKTTWWQCQEEFRQEWRRGLREELPAASTSSALDSSLSHSLRQTVDLSSLQLSKDLGHVCICTLEAALDFLPRESMRCAKAKKQDRSFIGDREKQF